MWQRKQTIFLALTGGLMIVMIFFPAWVAEVEGVQRALYPLHYSVTESGVKTVTYFPYAISAILAAAAATLSWQSVSLRTGCCKSKWAHSTPC